MRARLIRTPLVVPGPVRASKPASKVLRKGVLCNKMTQKILMQTIGTSQKVGRLLATSPLAESVADRICSDLRHSMALACVD